jgi:mannose-1-phosphate guanylyltransferase
VKEIRSILLAAGLGTRLKPLSNNWPKCLMPIGRKPLLEYWLETLNKLGIENVLVNTHYHAEEVEKFLSRPRFNEWVQHVYEATLLGTAGTIRKNKDFIGNNPLLLVHADNWCRCNFKDFIEYHFVKRPSNCLITMMTFDTANPEDCGIVEVDSFGIVKNFYEKVLHPPGTQANAAIYLIEPTVVQWIVNNPKINDFSTEVLPHFIGHIATWKNEEIHRDIGTPSNLILARSDAALEFHDHQIGLDECDYWCDYFAQHPIHNEIKNLSS